METSRLLKGELKLFKYLKINQVDVWNIPFEVLNLKKISEDLE